MDNIIDTALDIKIPKEFRTDRHEFKNELSLGELDNLYADEESTLLV